MEDLAEAREYAGLPGITFEAGNYGLRAVFTLLPKRVWTLEWRAIPNFEVGSAPGREDVAQAVYRCADSGAGLRGDLLRHLVEADLQVIDGELAGYTEGPQAPDIILRSIRGDGWDIEARNPEELAAIASQIPSAHPHPDPKL